MTIGCQGPQRRPAISTRLELASIDRNMTIRNVCDLNLSFIGASPLDSLGVRLASPGGETYDPTG